MPKPSTISGIRSSVFGRGRPLAAMLWLVAAMMGFSAQAADVTKRNFDVPVGEAFATLKLFATQADGRLLYAADAVDGVKTRAFKGEASPREALDGMLAGSGLEVIQSDSGALAIRRKPNAAPARETAFVKIPVEATAPKAAAADETVRLPTFTIRSEKDISYVGRQALSTTRTGVELSDLPQSVVVLNKTFLDDMNPTILAKALNYVGGAQTGTITWSVDRYMIRGFVGEGDYVDGFRTQTDKNTDFNLIDHVEIIKGPSAIFIANQNNTVGGVINKISKSPTDYHVGSITVQAGLWDGNRADFDLGGPITADKKLRYRLLVAGQDSKGYYDFTYEKRTSILPMLAYQFSETTEAWLKFEAFSSHYSAYNGIPFDGRTNQIAAIPIRRNLSEDTPQNWRTDRFHRLWGQVTTRPSDFLAIRFAGFDSRDEQRRVESVLIPSGATMPTLNPVTGVATFSPFPQYVIPPNYTAGQLIARNTTAINSDRQPRREFQNDYVFNFATGAVNHKFLLGADFIDYPQRTRTYSSGPTSTASSTGIDPFQPSYPGTVSVDFNQPPTNITERSQTFAKVYALETASFLRNRVIVSFGVTRSRFALALTSTNFDQVTGTASAPTVIPRSLLYRNLVQYGIVVKPLPNLSVFYGYNKNFSANGIQFGEFLPAQEGEQKELGLKSQWLDQRLTVSLNHFEVVQLYNAVPAFPQTTPPSNILVPGTISRGYDGDFSYSVTGSLDVIGSFAWFDAKVPLPTPWNRAQQPYDGKIYRSLPVNNVSERNVAAWTRYKFSGRTLKGLSLGVGVSYIAKRAITDNANLVFYGYVPGRTLVDAVVGYETRHAKYQLNIDNLFNRSYIYASRSNQVIIPGTPTNLRASATFKF